MHGEPIIPFHHENEPSEFCSTFSPSTASFNLFLIEALSKKLAILRFCSLSFLASATHGVSSRMRFFSSWFFSSCDASDFSLPVSCCHSLNTFSMFGELFISDKPRVLA